MDEQKTREQQLIAETFAQMERDREEGFKSQVRMKLQSIAAAQSQVKQLLAVIENQKKELREMKLVLLDQSEVL